MTSCGRKYELLRESRREEDGKTSWEPSLPGNTGFFSRKLFQSRSKQNSLTWWYPVHVTSFCDPGRNCISWSQIGTRRSSQSFRTWCGGTYGTQGVGKLDLLLQSSIPQSPSRPQPQSVASISPNLRQSIPYPSSLTFLALNTGCSDLCRSHTFKAFSFPHVATTWVCAGSWRILHTPGPTFSSKS